MIITDFPSSCFCKIIYLCNFLLGHWSTVFDVHPSLEAGKKRGNVPGKCHCKLF